MRQRQGKRERTSLPSSILIKTVASGDKATRATFFRFSNDNVLDLLLLDRKRVSGVSPLLARASSFFSSSIRHLPSSMTTPVPSQRASIDGAEAKDVLRKAMNSLDEIKDGDSIPNWTNDRVPIWCEENVTLTVNGSTQVGKLECGSSGHDSLWVD